MTTPVCDLPRGICNCSTSPTHADAGTLLGCLIRRPGQGEANLKKSMLVANYLNVEGFYAAGGWLGKSGEVTYVTKLGLEAYIARRLLDRDQSTLPENICYVVMQQKGTGKALEKPRRTIPELA